MTLSLRPDKDAWDAVIFWNEAGNVISSIVVTSSKSFVEMSNGWTC
jgi:hypothetical protein